ncbi:MAG: hypothetical protein VXW65_03900 [Pseudomonadota bacterium]|nr:hypothetical protein [Pseudomonadota bacterium]
MASFKQQVERFEQEEKNLSSKRQALSEAIQSAIADRVCADIGGFRAHVIALPMAKEQSLHWRWLAGRSEELAVSTDAFAGAMVKHGYLIKKEMYFSGDYGQDIELDQEEIDQCVCPIRGEQVSKEYFDENRYPLWETTSRWAEMIDAVYESEMPVRAELPMKIFDVDGDGCYAANNAEEFRAWYVDKYGVECAEYVEDLTELTVEQAEKRMVIINDYKDQRSLRYLLNEHVVIKGKVIAMLSCEHS